MNTLQPASLAGKHNVSVQPDNPAQDTVPLVDVLDVIERERDMWTGIDDSIAIVLEDVARAVRARWGRS